MKSVIEDIVISVIADKSALDYGQILNLYIKAKWWPEPEQIQISEELKQIQKIVEGSFCFVIARKDSRIIGMARAISDGVSDAYIQDVMVDQDFRRCGIGRKLVNRLMTELVQSNIEWIGLIAEPGTSGIVEFYRSFGFELLKGYQPMLYSAGKKF